MTQVQSRADDAAASGGGAGEPRPGGAWSPESWRSRPAAQDVVYPDAEAVARAVARLKQLPPLVTSWEIDRLRREIAQAQRGERFILQGGDCAETLAECRPELIANKLKILLQMSLVLVHGLKRPVTRIGRIAGQYAKPRSSPTETCSVGGVPTELPSYFGDLVNQAAPTVAARTPNPEHMLAAYQHSALTLNFIRSLVDGGFADLHHPEQWDLSFFNHADLLPARKLQYERMKETLADGLRFMEALGEKNVAELTRVEFFTSHEGLNLWYESAQTRQVPRKPGWWDLTTHLPWIGERTRQADGAHIEFFRGIRNPVGVKIGPKADADELCRVIDLLNPEGEPGKLVLIARMGAGNVRAALPRLLERIRAHGSPVLWMCDPMHGNGVKTEAGIKTRNFDDILAELEATADLHEQAGTILGGVHFELTGEDVTECVGGAAGVTPDDLTRNYATLCDPRLNYQQSLELAFLLAGKLSR
mgnify:CR=1 FL=1